MSEADKQRSLNYFFPQPTVPIPPEVFAHPDHLGLEDLVDQFIANNKMRENDTFVIPYPEGPKTFQYLGPNSGGRKDWMQISPRQSDLTS